MASLRDGYGTTFDGGVTKRASADIEKHCKVAIMASDNPDNEVVMVA